MVDRVFFKEDPAEPNELFWAVIQSVRRAFEAPFFTALREYAQSPVAVFHALPLSRGKSVAGSQWAREFAEFYGEGYFAGETSSTMAPLDSLFSPKRHLREAMELAAEAFGADRTRFVTNGTTGANSIVYQATLKPGDLVLLDRNCHKSHHYAAVQTGAEVVYMEPLHVDDYGISALVPMETILSAVKKYKDLNEVKEHKDKAKMLVLTHPTFDGLCYDPKEIMARVHQLDKNIVFLFDEAWFAYGIFHPDFRKYSTMAAARELRSEGTKTIRVYVTQSIHKTLSAMRQASMIHMLGPKDFLDNPALEESVISHTTTSPNVHLLASLDVARMQVQMEGFDRLRTARSIAERIRDGLSSSAVRPLTLKELARELVDTAEVGLDPLKITLCCEGIPGMKFRDEVLYKQRGIQINKYSHNTVMILVTIGTTHSMADHLVRSLRDWRPAEGAKRPSKIRIPRFSGFAEGYEGKIDGAGNLASAYYQRFSREPRNVCCLTALKRKRRPPRRSSVLIRPVIPFSSRGRSSPTSVWNIWLAA